MSFYTYVLCPHTPIYNAKWANLMLEVSVTCWTPMFRSTCSTILLKFGCKACLKKVWNTSLRRGPCHFHIWLRDLDWLRLASSFLSTLTGMCSSSNRTGNCGTLASFGEILKETRSLSHQTSVLDFFKSSSGTRASPPELLDIGDGDPDDPPTVQRVMALRSTLIGVSLYIFCKSLWWSETDSL